jgi:glycosyltransferase involved in cell wall biosynthesis
MAKGLARLLTEPGLRDQFRRNLASDPAGSDEVRETAWLVEKIEQPVPSAAPVSIPPKVSILIPTYNQEHSINVAIASALMQDFPALEVIVADDASTDGTAAITRRWSSDSRFRYLRNERNIGRVANYRRALCERAEGDWVLMLDGDDYLIDPGFIRRGWEALQRHADSAPLFAQAGHRIHYVYRKRSDVDIKPLIEGSERLMTGGEYLQFVFKTGFFTHLGALYHRKSAIEHQFYRADINSSDMESLLRLALEGKVLILNTLAGCWVQHGGNASSSLPLSQIPVNVRIFRQITRLAVQRGLVSWPEIAPALIHYEVGTLIHLLDRAAGKTMRGLLDLYRAPAVVISIDPRLLLNHQLLRFWPRYFWRLFQLSFERCLSSLAGWKAFKKPRPDKP